MQQVNENDQDEVFIPSELEPDFKVNPPAINLPGVLVALIALLTIIHAIRMFVLPENIDNQVIYLFAFIPASYGPLAASAPFPLSGYWSPVTHGLLHGSWVHLGMNVVWMAAFGAPVARRFGTVRFLILTAICTIGGAFFHYLTYENAFMPVIGASGAVSGYMGAASRFVFNNLGGPNRFDPYGQAMSLLESFTNRGFLIFFLVWMGMNYLFGAGIFDIVGEGNLIAWQAHIGGFLTGVFIFGLLDPVKKH